MKKILIISGLLFIILRTSGQNLSDLRARLATPITDTIAEGLVALALNSPTIGVAESTSRAFEYDYKKSQSAWLNNVVLSGNLNEYSLKKTLSSGQGNQNTLYPRYNLGVSIPLGLFVSNNKQTKANYYRYQATLAQEEITKQDVRREILTLYADYIKTKELLELVQQNVLDSKTLLERHETRFQKGEVSLEVYTNTSKTYTNEKAREVNLRYDLSATQNKLESWIGMRLVDAIQQITIKRN